MAFQSVHILKGEMDMIQNEFSLFLTNFINFKFESYLQDPNKYEKIK